MADRRLCARMQPALPTDPSNEELSRDWKLTEEDLMEVLRCRGDDKRLSFAIQLCTLRTYGRFFDDDYTAVPVRILNDVGRQIGLPPVLFAAPPARKQTDAEHEQRIRKHLGFVTFDDGIREELESWLRERIPETLLRREGDCEDLACWRLAELRHRSREDARPFVKHRVYGEQIVYHVAVRRSDGRIEDPSRVLGMR